MYHLWGPSQIPHYNLTETVFPCDRPYPYGATVRSYSGGFRSLVGDFPDDARIHRDAETNLIWTADARVVEELLARAGDFPKLWNRPAQTALQDFTGNGLFTSSETSEDWQTGHSVLPRSFNQIKVKSFAPQILAKTRAFVSEWSKFPAGHKVEGVSDWLTSMTADAVVACSMGLDMQNVERMGSGQPTHPFIENFRFGLGYTIGTVKTETEFGLKRFVPGFGAQAKLQAKYEECKKTMQAMVGDMVEATRRGEMGGQHSVIRSMLEDRAASGKHVRFNAMYGHVINLMIAGHETTAATLGFTLQLLAEHPECEAKALDEVRRVLQGRMEPEVDDVPKLQYVEQCFREALRLYSPVTTLNRDVAHDTLLQGRRVFQGERVNVIPRALHTNPEYWGGEFGNPLSFNPDRFAPEAVKNRHPNAYHPWGFGPRSCIGSQFALFEAKTFLASVLLHFRLEGVPGYKMTAALHEGGAAPTPKDLALIVYPRPGGPLCGPCGAMRPLAPLAHPPPADMHPAAQAQGAKAGTAAQEEGDAAGADGPLMKVLFGSNTGSSQEFATQVAKAARRAGFNASTSSLDAGVREDALVADGRHVVIVTSTYNGNPPDNACGFHQWLQAQADDSLRGLHFAVFGVGNSQWQTYQQFPREVDAGLRRCGAERVCALGSCDVDSHSFDSDFDDWLASLTQAIGGVSGEEDEAALELEEEAAKEFLLEEAGADTSGRPLMTDIKGGMETLVQAKREAMEKLGVSGGANMLRSLEVAEGSRELCQRAVDGRSVRHVTLRLPEGLAAYRAGDHLQVLPPNDPALVAMALEAIGVDPAAPVRWDPSVVRINYRAAEPGNDEELRPAMPRMRATAEVVATWVPDLAAVPSRKVVARLARRVADAEARAELQGLAGDAKLFKEAVEERGLSLAELLLRYKGRLGITLGELCCVVAKPLAWRFYSVSSSPAGAADPRLVTVSVGRVEYTTKTGRVHRGLASCYLGDLPVGGVVPGLVRSLAGNFHLPEDPAAPIIMVGPGTGVAPMMGFLQERAELLRSGRQLGPAVLFFGCRRRDEDFLYEEELKEHQQSGALSELHVAFSREGAQKVYVQDLIWEQRQAVWKLLQQPSARVYVCGDARAMAPDVRKAFQRVAQECGGRSSSGATNMVAAMVEGGRYLEDVWAA